MRCFCGRPAPWVVAVVGNDPAGGVTLAEDALPACNGHVGLVALNLIKHQHARPRHAYRLVLRGPEVERLEPAAAPDDLEALEADDMVGLEAFVCPACGSKGTKLAAMTEGFCGRCGGWTWPPASTGSAENRPR